MFEEEVKEYGDMDRVLWTGRDSRGAPIITRLQLFTLPGSSKMLATPRHARLSVFKLIRVMAHRVFDRYMPLIIQCRDLVPHSLVP